MGLLGRACRAHGPMDHAGMTADCLVRRSCHCSNRMLKKSASGVLASFRPSTYPRGYASALHSLRPCWTNFLSILRGRVLLSQTCGPLDFRLAGIVFPQPTKLLPHVAW